MGGGGHFQHNGKMPKKKTNRNSLRPSGETQPPQVLENGGDKSKKGGGGGEDQVCHKEPQGKIGGGGQTSPKFQVQHGF